MSLSFIAKKTRWPGDTSFSSWRRLCQLSHQPSLFSLLPKDASSHMVTCLSHHRERRFQQDRKEVPFWDHFIKWLIDLLKNKKGYWQISSQSRQDENISKHMSIFAGKRQDGGQTRLNERHTIVAFTPRFTSARSSQAAKPHFFASRTLPLLQTNV